ncbi:MAG TPA: hypothetical protein VHQ94_23075 [Pyrinomonadaceae bacterium]|jgi:hypothetical protein|nr:hypothetical protein [Pyrinomonadaceae bacterium]
MNAKFSFLSLLLIVLFSTQISLANEPTAMLARKAVSTEAAEATAAIEELRAMGPAGLEALLGEYSDQINRHIAEPWIGSSPEWERIAKALDLVGRQKNNFVSHLYWYTDLEDAKKAARESGKPILSLRLLGNLTDELSCANSRFFRTVLYPNTQIREILRNRYVLHWKSVRPAPRITVDFGDGRKIESTITGNSIHYVLDSDGQLIEAIPGLYGPAAFQRNLVDAETLFKSVAGKTGQERNLMLYKYYSDRQTKIALAWKADTKQFGNANTDRLRILPSQESDAVRTGPAAATKMGTERTFVRSITTASEALGRLTDEQAWRIIAGLHFSDALLDGRSIQLIRWQNRSLDTSQTARLIGRFQENIALDAVRNEYIMRPVIYGFMMTETYRADLEKLNEIVYSKLFYTSGSDQWLGLISPDMYTALDNGGVIKGQ